MSQYYPSPPLAWPHYGIGFSGAVRRGFATYGTFSGRASRGEYWWWTLFAAGSLLVLAIPAAVLGTLTSPDGGETPPRVRLPARLSVRGRPGPSGSPGSGAATGRIPAACG